MFGTKTLLALFVILFLNTFGYGLLFPQLYFEPSFHSLPFFELSEHSYHFMVGVMLISYPLAQCFGAPFFGRLSDQYGRKRILTLTIVGTIMGDLFSALSIHAHSYLFLLASQLLSGFFAANLVLCLAILTDLFGTKKTRGRSLCLVSAILGFSWMLSFFLVIFFTKEGLNYHPALPFWLFGLLSLISLFILKIAIPETAPSGACSNKKLPPHKHLRHLYLILLFFSLGLFISLQWLSPLSIIKFQTSIKQILLTFLSVGSIWVISSLLLGNWVVSHLCLWKVNLWTLFFIGLLLFFAASTDYYGYFIFSYSSAILFAALAWGILITLISMAAKEGEQGHVMGMVQSMFAVGKLLAPLLGGMIAGLSLQLVLYACSLLVFISFLLLLINVVRRSHKDVLTQY